MNTAANKKKLAYKKSQSKTKVTKDRSKPSTDASNGQSLAYSIYLDSLAPTGARAMKSLLAKVPQYLGSSCVSDQFPWNEIDYQKVQRVRSQMQLDGYSVNTINQALSALKGVANAAFNLEQISADSLMRIRSVKAVKGSVQRPGRSITKQEIRKVIKTLSKQRTFRSMRDKTIFMVGIGGGLRCSELVALKVEDVGIEDGRITVNRGKGNVQREVYVAEETLITLKNWITVLGTPAGPVFRRIGKNDVVYETQLSTNGVRNIITELAELAGVEAFSPHDMRRTFVTQLLVSNVDLNTVRRLAGHSSISTTSIYDKRGDEVLRRASQELCF